MIIRNFAKPVCSIDDISNIPERRRFVIIYKYPDGPHNTMFEIYQNEIYDLYVINTSTLIGSDYIIPKNLVVQYKNTYRGKVINPFNFDGDINLKSFCTFNTSSFYTRIINGIDIIRFAKNDLLSNGTYEDYIANIMKCDTIIPFPTYYNIEDQARLAKGDYQKMDFEIFLNDVPQYTLNDFRDAKTTFISLEIHEDNLFNNQKQLNSILYGFDGAISGDIEAQNITDMVREHFLAVFLDCYDIIARSIFAQAYIIVDLESGLLTVDKDTLTLKHSYKMSKEEITKEYAAIVQQIDGTVESLDVFSTDYMNECFCQFENIPYRVMFYISPSKCRIKLVYNKENLLPKIKNIPTSSEYSSSDADESVTAREGETLFPDYDSSDDVPF